MLTTVESSNGFVLMGKARKKRGKNCRENKAEKKTNSANIYFHFRWRSIATNCRQVGNGFFSKKLMEND